MKTTVMWDEYLKWMLDRIHFNKKRYYKLISYLHNVPFYVSRSAYMDENRRGDGLYLREYFFADMGLKTANFDKDCSVCEMLVAFSERIGEEYLGFDNTGFEHPDRIFMLFLTNLGLDVYTNNEYKRRDKRSIELEIDEILGIFMDRKYKNDGYGSLFPIGKVVNGYNRMELFMQMNIYFNKKHINGIDDLAEMDDIK